MLKENRGNKTEAVLKKKIYRVSKKKKKKKERDSKSNNEDST